jgi:hypothetical protein
MKAVAVVLLLALAACALASDISSAELQEIDMVRFFDKKLFILDFSRICLTSVLMHRS